MKHPDKWRETENPFTLPYRNFTLTEVIGYPHAGNDVFQARGVYRQEEVEAYIKIARQAGADIRNEISVINALHCSLAPQIIDGDDREGHYIVTLAKEGERLSVIVGENTGGVSLDYMFEYGQTLAELHSVQADFGEVKDRKFFHIPDKAFFEASDLGFVYEYLISNQPETINRCFCHGDFHYANILWADRHISGILDFELAGIGNREFDIAWALILRPGQKFLNTEKEIMLFKEGYFTVGSCNWNYVKYYMVLIYTYFYRLGNDVPGYCEYIMAVFKECCFGDKAISFGQVS